MTFVLLSLQKSTFLKLQMQVNFALFLINSMKHIHFLFFAYIFNRLENHFILSIFLNLIIFESYSFSEMPSVHVWNVNLRSIKR